MQIEIVLDELKRELQNILKGNLVGIYVHGSYAMNAFNPQYSDLDIIVVVEKPMSCDDKRRIVQKLIELTEIGPQKGLEISIVLEKTVQDLHHPLYFDFHFSNFHLKRYIEDEQYMCECSYDSDLIAHVKVLKERGIALFGRPIDEVFGEVKKSGFIDSILNDLEAMDFSTDSNITYYVLNLLRFYYYLKDDKIYSKIEAGKRALGEFGNEDHNIIVFALSNYEESAVIAGENFDSNLAGFTRSLIEVINQELSKVSSDRALTSNKLLINQKHLG